MAEPKKSNKAPAAEPVNSEQLEQLAAEAAPAGPSFGELEERTAEAENRAEAAERRNAELAQELAELKAQFAQLARQARSPQSRPDSADSLNEAPLEAPSTPVFEETLPHGIVVGDAEVAYVQDGHQFGRDRQYLRTEKHRGTPRAFNPRLVGWVKPRPGQQLADVLDGFRDR